MTSILIFSVLLIVKVAFVSVVEGSRRLLPDILKT